MQYKYRRWIYAHLLFIVAFWTPLPFWIFAKLCKIMKLRILTVDAFTSEAFSGNPAAICLTDKVIKFAYQLIIFLNCFLQLPRRWAKMCIENSPPKWTCRRRHTCDHWMQHSKQVPHYRTFLNLEFGISNFRFQIWTPMVHTLTWSASLWTRYIGHGSRPFQCPEYGSQNTHTHALSYSNFRS